MKWQTAVSLARTAEDVSYEEWCDLYYNVKNPTKEQIDKACKAAHSILVRNNAIVPSVEFIR